MTVDLVPNTDLVPSLASRIVTVNATDAQEGTWAAGESVRFRIVGDVHVPADRRIVLGHKGVTLPLPDGRGQVRLPVWTAATGEWAVEVKPSWTPHPYYIRVPAGSGSVDLSQINPLHPVDQAIAQWLLTNATVTATEGAAWSANVSVAGGNAHFNFTVPPGGTAYWRGSTSLPASANLDTLEPGRYRVGNTADATALGLPNPGAGFLDAAQYSTMSIQQWHPNRRANTPETWVRQQLSGGGWSSWVLTTVSAEERAAWTDAATTAVRDLGVLTEADNYKTLTPATYRVPSGGIATAAGLPLARHGTLIVGGANTAGSIRTALFVTTSTSSAPSEVWVNATDGSGTWGQFMPILVGDQRWDRALPAGETRAELDALPSGLYRVGGSAEATGMGLPSPGVGFIEVFAYGSIGIRRWHPNRRANAPETWVSHNLGGSNGWSPWVRITTTPQERARWDDQPSRGELSGLVQAEAQNVVPGIVADAIAEDDSIRQAAVAAVADASTELGLVTTSAPTPSSAVVSASPIQYPLPQIATHNAFPGLARRPSDGAYVAVWRAGSGHNSTDGRVHLSTSLDGITWSDPLVVPQDIEGDVRDPALTAVGDALLLTYYLAAPGPQRSYLRRSTDGGATWGPSEPLPFNSGGIEFISAPLVVADGAWLVTAYGNSAVRVLRSTDEGATWSAPIVVTTGGVQEPNIVALDGGHARILWRINYGGQTRTALSNDGGLTWGTASDAFWGQGNPHVIRLRSGALVATYKSVAGHSTNEYSYGCARVSFDDGGTWGPEVRFGYASRKMTYAVAVETDVDGEMVCVWSCETSNTEAQMYAVRLTIGSAVTSAGDTPSPVTPRAGIARQFIEVARSGNQSIPSEVWEPVAFDAEVADHWEGFHPSSSQTTFRVDERGLYMITARLAWDTVVPFTAVLRDDTGRDVLHDRWGDSNGFTMDGTLTGPRELFPERTYSLVVRHQAGSPASLLGGSEADKVRLLIAKIRDESV